MKVIVDAKMDETSAGWKMKQNQNIPGQEKEKRKGEEC